AETVEELRAEIHSGGPRKPPRQARVPRWTERAVARGLAPVAQERHPSMEALLEAISVSPLKRWRRPLWTATALAVIGIGLGGYRKLHARQVLLCQGAERKLAGVWDGERRRSIERAFMASGKRYAGFALQAASGKLDQYAARWVAMHRDACEATRVRGHQSADLLDRRMECLEERRQHLAALTQVLGVAGAEEVQHAVRAAADLPRIDDCADPPALRKRERPLDPAVRGKIEALQADLARGKALRGVGNLKEARAVIQNLLTAARSLGNRSFEAKVLRQWGGLQVQMGDLKAA